MVTLLNFLRTLHTVSHVETIKVPFNSWLEKEEVVHIHYGVLLSRKKRWNTAIVTTWVDLETIKLSEISQPEKAKKPMISLICGIENWNS